MINIGILTVSDRTACGMREDISGKKISKIVERINGKIVDYAVSSDDLDEIKSHLICMCEKNLDIVITTGGTGLSPRDNTPEATLEVIEKEIPGIPEAMRQMSLEKTCHAMLSRARAGILNNTIIVNLPGSPKAVKENLEVILPALPHAVEVLQGKVIDCGK